MAFNALKVKRQNSVTDSQAKKRSLNFVVRLQLMSKW